jgi:hypothetical protein
MGVIAEIKKLNYMCRMMDVGTHAMEVDKGERLKTIEMLSNPFILFQGGQGFIIYESLVVVKALMN